MRDKSGGGTRRSEHRLGLFKEVMGGLVPRIWRQGASRDCAQPSHLGPRDPVARQLEGHPLNNSSDITSDIWSGKGWAQCPPGGAHGVEGADTQDVSVTQWV